MLIFPLINDTSRKIIHIDMDAFFASVEERDNPKLKGKPVIIGSDPRQTGGRGVVSTCNYEARKFGVHSAMSSKEAYERCPQGIFISGNYEKYQTVGLQIREIFKRYTDKIEPMSIDEAYLDVTENKLGLKSAVKIAKLIQHDIWNELQLTASAGVSYNKFLAKIASDYEKPHGLTVILLKIPEMTLIDKFGRFGFDLYRKARGISNSPVKSNRIRKSIGKERTYAKLLHGEEDIKKELSRLAAKVALSLEKHQKAGKTVVLKIRYADFSTLTKRRTLEQETKEVEVIERVSHEIYDSLEEQPRGVRLLGLTVTGFG